MNSEPDRGYHFTSHLIWPSTVQRNSLACADFGAEENLPRRTVLEANKENLDLQRLDETAG